MNLGISLSAFNLTLTNNTKTFSVECAFQGSKVFENVIPILIYLIKHQKKQKR